ncbi:MAG: ferritin-like domain-containing protein [Acidimicrobiales bacterium]|nr:ferritin-like domain-containing protein [Acidimicrobiales bacterium]
MTPIGKTSDLSQEQRLEAFEDVVCQANINPHAEIRKVQDNSDAIFTWDYKKGRREKLDKLYEKAKSSQWNASTDLDWSSDVDVERIASEINNNDYRGMYVAMLMEAQGSPISNWGTKEWTEYSTESFAWRISQFMHGEQGALLATAKIVETVPWIDAKYYAATQVVDEARHVEVFARYLQEKIPSEYPINHHLQDLLDDIISDSRWDITYLGMQIMVEGLALAAFGSMHRLTEEPLLKTLLRYIMSDEARHVAFGVVSLQEYYQELTTSEILERQEFAHDAAERMQGRFLQQEVWDRLGVDVREMSKIFLQQDPSENIFQQMLFSKIVPNCKKLGLLDAGDGYLRKAFAGMGVIQYEDFVSTDEEYGSLDEVAKDRALD